MGFLGAEGDKRFRLNKHHSRLSCEHRASGATLFSLACRPQGLHGFGQERLIICDEPASWAANQREAAWEIIRTSLGKEKYTTILIIGTRAIREELEGRNSDHFFDRLLDGEADAIFDYSNPVDAPLTLKSARRSNPSMGYNKVLSDRVRRDLKDARRSKTAEQSYRALRLNSGVMVHGDDEHMELCSMEDWKTLAETDDLPERDGPFSLGIDVGGKSSFTAGSAWWPNSGRLESLTMTQSVPDLSERARSDGVGNLYDRLVQSGDLIVVDGRLVDVADFLDACVDRFGIPAVITTDRWRSAELEAAIEESESLDRVPLVYRGMGFQDMGQDCRLWQQTLLEGRIRTRVDAVLRLALADSRLLADPAGNTKVDRRNRRGKNDAAVASILSVATGIRETKLMRPRRKSVYFGRSARRAS